MKRYRLIAWVTLTALILAGAFQLSLEHARHTATNALADYVTKEDLSISAFPDTRESWEFGSRVFDYASTTKPLHSVRIYIDPIGNSELHRLIEP